MDVREIYRGRLIDHVQFVVSDLAASRKFYTAVFEAIGVPWGGDGPDFFWVDELFVSSVASSAAQGEPTGRAHIAFQAPDRATVDRFHTAAIAAGGRDHGAPGKRPYHPGYYAAFALDPDGNNIEVVYHGRHARSADAVKITF